MNLMDLFRNAGVGAGQAAGQGGSRYGGSALGNAGAMMGGQPQRSPLGSAGGMFGGGGQVRAVGQGGSRNPFSAYDPQRTANPMEALGLGSSTGMFQGPRTYNPGADFGTGNVDMEWLGRNIRSVASMPNSGRSFGIASRAGANTAAQYAPPPPVRNPFFSNDWSGMRNNIGYPPSTGLGGMAAMMGGQGSPYGGMGGGSLGSLLGLLTGGR